MNEAYTRSIEWGRDNDIIVSNIILIIITRITMFLVRLKYDWYGMT